MGIIAWIIFGLIAGAIAKLLMPGNDGGGFILTCVLGVIGAVVGGWLATMFGLGGSISGFNLHSFLVVASWAPSSCSWSSDCSDGHNPAKHGSLRRAVFLRSS